MTEMQMKVLARVFDWAWRNHLDVTLRRYVIASYGEGPAGAHPDLCFSNGLKQRCMRFRSFDELTDRMRYEWHQIAIDLCVEPLNLEKL